MKKDNIRTIAFLILIMVSLCSYSYLSYVSRNTTTAPTSTANKEEKIEEASLYYPDITLVKKLIKLGSKMMATQL